MTPMKYCQDPDPKGFMYPKKQNIGSLTLV